MGKRGRAARSVPRTLEFNRATTAPRTLLVAAIGAFAGFLFRRLTTDRFFFVPSLAACVLFWPWPRSLAYYVIADLGVAFLFVTVASDELALEFRRCSFRVFKVETAEAEAQLRPAMVANESIHRLIRPAEAGALKWVDAVGLCKPRRRRKGSVATVSNGGGESEQEGGVRQRCMRVRERTHRKRARKSALFHGRQRLVDASTAAAAPSSRIPSFAELAWSSTLNALETRRSRSAMARATDLLSLDFLELSFFLSQFLKLIFKAIRYENRSLPAALSLSLSPPALSAKILFRCCRPLLSPTRKMAVNPKAYPLAGKKHHLPSTKSNLQLPCTDPTSIMPIFPRT